MAFIGAAFVSAAAEVASLKYIKTKAGKENEKSNFIVFLKAFFTQTMMKTRLDILKNQAFVTKLL